MSVEVDDEAIVIVVDGLCLVLMVVVVRRERAWYGDGEAYMAGCSRGCVYIRHIR